MYNISETRQDSAKVTIDYIPKSCTRYRLVPKCMTLNDFSRDSRFLTYLREIRLVRLFAAFCLCSHVSCHKKYQTKQTACTSVLSIEIYNGITWFSCDSTTMYYVYLCHITNGGHWCGWVAAFDTQRSPLFTKGTAWPQASSLYQM